MSSIEEKIAKLLRLANNNPNEAEATAAAEKAQDLMLKHGIEMGQVSLDDGERPSIQGMAIKGKLDDWRVNLASTIARSAGGDLVYYREYGKWHGTLHFYGPRGSVESMIKLYLYLEEQLDRISKLEAALVFHINAAQSMRWRRSYLYGLSMRVCARLEARVQAAESESMALVPVRDAVKDRIEEELGPTKVVNSRPEVDEAAVAQGYIDGSRVALGDSELNERTARELLDR